MGNIRLEIQDKIAIVTLDKKPLNICDRYFYSEIKDFMEALNGRDDYNVVILRSDCRHFSAGGDINEISETFNKGFEGPFENYPLPTVPDALGSIINCKKPVIAAVNGKAIGAGTAIAASCDIIIADEEAIFAIPEITVGIIGAAEFLQLLIPRRLARYYVLTGKHLKAQEVKAFGGILDVVPKENLLKKALEVAGEISALAPMSVTLFKQYLNDNDNERLGEKYAHGAELGRKFHKTRNAKETINSVLEKRKPLFTEI